MTNHFNYATTLEDLKMRLHTIGASHFSLAYTSGYYTVQIAAVVKGRLRMVAAAGDEAATAIDGAFANWENATL